MSDRTASSLTQWASLSALVTALPDTPAKAALAGEMDALERAIRAFHMEAIRFRMYNVERQLHQQPDQAALTERFAALRHALEEAGFHTRSHSAP
jgi:hypothetical protein